MTQISSVPPMEISSHFSVTPLSAMSPLPTLLGGLGAEQEGQTDNRCVAVCIQAMGPPLSVVSYFLGREIGNQSAIKVYRIAGKFGGDLNLAVGLPTAKSTKISSSHIYVWRSCTEPTNLNLASMFVMAIWDSTTKFNSRQYFQPLHTADWMGRGTVVACVSTCGREKFYTCMLQLYSCYQFLGQKC